MKIIISYLLSLGFFISAFCNLDPVNFAAFLPEELETEGALKLLDSIQAIRAEEMMSSHKFGFWAKAAADKFFDQAPTGDAHLNGTLKLNLFKARERYNDWKKENPDISASFFGYALWHLIQTLKKPEFGVFHLRKVAGQHFYVQNPDIWSPVIYGDNALNRGYGNLVLQNTYQMKTLREFMTYYQTKLAHIRAGNNDSSVGLNFAMAHFISKLNRSYVTLETHMFPKHWSGRPTFYFDPLEVENLGMVLGNLHFKWHHAYLQLADGEDLIQSFEDLINSETLHTVSAE
jgi:hypothetical protein